MEIATLEQSLKQICNAADRLTYRLDKIESKIEKLEKEATDLREKIKTLNWSAERTVEAINSLSAEKDQS